MSEKVYPVIPKEKFRFTTTDPNIHDTKFETKPIGYFKDAWIRFKKNKSSVAGAVIIIIIILFSFIAPLVSPYDISFSVTAYSKKLPRNAFLSNFGICTGINTRQCNNNAYALIAGMGIGAADTDGSGATLEEGLANEYCPAKNIGDMYITEEKEYRDIDVDVYLEVGFRYLTLSEAEYNSVLSWEQETGKQIIYPMVDTYSEYCYDVNDANYWYKTKPGKPQPIKETDFGIADVYITEGGTLEDNYLRDAEGNVRFFQNVGTAMKKVRVLYYNYYEYLYGFEPYYIFGTDSSGYDICVRLANGIRLSLLLALCVSLINFTIGTVYGAIEGYYGGLADLIMERISDILSGVPFIIVVTLFQFYYASKVGPVVTLLFAFVLTGWLGTAYRVRTQFYRFKNSEYVYAARTLGAKDARLMFKHILPNSLGTIITSSVLVIPGVIFSESSLSYLGIVNLIGDSGASLGTMLSTAQPSMTQFPHMLFFPALIISLLMISFNLFGNGLRDAFNPSLRGADE